MTYAEVFEKVIKDKNKSALADKKSQFAQALVETARAYAAEGRYQEGSVFAKAAAQIDEGKGWEAYAAIAIAAARRRHYKSMQDALLHTNITDALLTHLAVIVSKQGKLGRQEAQRLAAYARSTSSEDAIFSIIIENSDINEEAIEDCRFIVYLITDPILRADAMLTVISNGVNGGVYDAGNVHDSLNEVLAIIRQLRPNTLFLSGRYVCQRFIELAAELGRADLAREALEIMRADARSYDDMEMRCMDLVSISHIAANAGLPTVSLEMLSETAKIAESITEKEIAADAFYRIVQAYVSIAAMDEAYAVAGKINNPRLRDKAYMEIALRETPEGVGRALKNMSWGGIAKTMRRINRQLADKTSLPYTDIEDVED